MPPSLPPSLLFSHAINEMRVRGTASLLRDLYTHTRLFTPQAPAEVDGRPDQVIRVIRVIRVIVFSFTNAEEEVCRPKLFYFF